MKIAHRIRRSTAAWLLCLLLLLPFSLGGCGELSVEGYQYTKNYTFQDRTVVATLDEREIPLDLYRYFYRSHLDDLRIDGADNPEEEAHTLTEESLRHFFAVYDLAKEYGLTLTEEQQEEIANTMTEQKASYETEEAYVSDMELYYMTEEVCYNLLLNTTVEGLLYEYMSEEASGIIDSTDATVLKDIQENFYAAIQYYVMLEEGDDPETVYQELTALLEDRRVASMTDEEFETFAVEEGDDAYGVRYFTKGYTYDFFETAVSALKIGETSGVIESYMGFHVIRRVALDANYIDTYFEDLRYDSITRRYNELLAEKEVTYRFATTEHFSEESLGS